MQYDLTTSLNRSSGTSGGLDRGFQYRTDAGVSFTQPLLKNFWTDVGRTDIKLKKRQLKISELALAQVLMDTVTKVKKAYYDLTAAREDVKVKAKALELARQLLEENKKKVQIGTLAPLDEKQAEAQAAGALAELITARQKFSGAQNTLKNLLTDDYHQWHGVILDPADRLGAVPAALDLSTSWSNGLRLRQLKAARRCQAKARSSPRPPDRSALWWRALPRCGLCASAVALAVPFGCG